MAGSRERLTRAERELEVAAAAENPSQRLKGLSAALELLDSGGWGDERISGLAGGAGAARDRAARILLSTLAGQRRDLHRSEADRLPALLHRLRPELERLRAAARVGKQRIGPDGEAAVELNPPSFSWPPIEGANAYSLEIRRRGGEAVYESATGGDPVHLPSRALEPGWYEWQALGLDRRQLPVGRVGPRSLFVPPGLPRLLPKTARELLSRLPDSHPRLLFSRQRLDRIRATLGGSRREAWTGLLEAAERALSSAPPSYPDFHRIPDPLEARLPARRYFHRLEEALEGGLVPLALAYAVSEQERFAEAAKGILLPIAAWPVEEGDPTSVSSPIDDSPALCLARCLPRAYDWLHLALSERERRLVRETCRRRARQALDRLRRRDYFSYPGDSHAGRLIPILGEMGLVLAGECDEAEAWLDYSLRAVTTCYPHWGGVDGGWAEGTAYAGVYNLFYIPLFETLREQAGFDLWKRPFYGKVGRFFLYCLPPCAEVGPFGDSMPSGSEDGSVSAEAVPLVGHLARRFADPCLQWWTRQAPPAQRGGELDLFFEGDMEAEPPSRLPASRLFRGIGWAALHSRLDDPRRDTVLVFKSSPYGTISHSHADQNGFCILKGGRALAVPSGYYGPVAGTPHHLRWTAATRASNCVLVDGRGQRLGSAEAVGAIVAFRDWAGGSYVAGEAARAYGPGVRRCRRHVLFVRPCLFMILDELETEVPVRFQWLLHSLEPMTVDLAIGRADLCRRGATLQVHLRSPVGLDLSKTDRFSTPYNEGLPAAHHRDLPNQWHLTAETRTPAAATRVAAALVVGAEDEVYEVETMESGGRFGARAVGQGIDVEAWAQLTDEPPSPSEGRRHPGEEAPPIWGRSGRVKLLP